MEDKRKKLIEALTYSIENDGAGKDGPHQEAENLLLDLLDDHEIKKLWKEASENWWYA